MAHIASGVVPLALGDTVEDGGVQPPESCVTCGARVEHAFCPACGEQRASSRHYSLGHFAAEAVEAFSHFDGRVTRTVRTLLARPGALTVAYMHGVRRPFMAPLQLFLVTNVVYFLWVALTHTNTFGTPLQFHVDGMFYSDVARRLVLERIAARGITYSQYATTFDHAAMLQAKSLIILTCPLFALGVALVVLPKRRYAVEHLTFALHTMSALLLALIAVQLVAGVVIAIATRVGHAHLAWQTWDKVTTLTLLVLLGAYLRASLRRVYGFGQTSALVRAALSCVVFIATVFLYRGVLFFTTFAVT